MRTTTTRARGVLRMRRLMSNKVQALLDSLRTDKDEGRLMPKR